MKKSEIFDSFIAFSTRLNRIMIVSYTMTYALLASNWSLQFLGIFSEFFMICVFITKFFSSFCNFFHSIFNNLRIVKE